MDGIGENIKKILLAGIGAVATTTEKSKELLDEMVKKGELTVEQGKVLNEELKHNIKKTMKEKVNVSVKVSDPEELDELEGRLRLHLTAASALGGMGDECGEEKHIVSKLEKTLEV